MRTIKSVHKAISTPIDDLVTYNALPGDSLSLETLNPFIFLNHHGPQVYPANNNGLPFGPHPHRGMETVTFILDGDIKHKDSGGFESVITAGGIQWMTAGRGLIHMETSSDEFKKNGGPLEILQLWLNLPAKDKMKEPFYSGLQKKDIPEIKINDSKVTVNLISGKWEDTKGAFESITDVLLSTIFFKPGSTLTLDVPEDNQVFFYIIKGKLNVNKKEINAFNLVLFDHDSKEIKIESASDSILLFGHAKPLNERIVAQGPFVMNSQQEILEAYRDYRNGKFGIWQD
ncbi:MAG: pirin family protein [Ignavibacteriaceae bacterium]